MVNSFVAKKDLDSQMTVVRNEFESGENDPGRILLQRAMSTAFLWHNYGNSTIGARSDIENVPIERLQNFYKTYYQPDNAVLLVAGKFDEAKTLDLIVKNFAPIPRPARVLPKIYTSDPVQDGECAVTLRRVGDVQIVTPLTGASGSHPDFAAVHLAEVRAHASGRLHRRVERRRRAIFAQLQLWSGRSRLRAEVRQESSLDEARARPQPV